MSLTGTLHPVSRRRGVRADDPAPARIVRCAIYVRQSVEDRTASGFTSLDAQTESALAYIASLRSEGWQSVGETYADPGFSGGNTTRPALTRLIADIEQGRIDVVVVYKIDRLSRSLLDFLNLLQFFERHQVSFVSVTQQINTATSAGRLMLNIIAGFGEYERSVISERTRDKMCAARKKGKWCGGPPILGYDVDRDKKRLVINKDEAEQVRTIFDLYLQQRGMIPVCRELNRRGWTTKTITYKNGRHKEGVPWNKARLYDMLVNVTYIGKVRHQGQLYPGEQDAIVDKRVFREVQTLLRLNSQNGGADTRNKHGALLRGLLKCGHCGAAMAHTYTQKGNRLYRYYMCLTKMKRGKDACPTPTLPAQEIEDFVVEQIKALARDPELQRQVFGAAGKQQQRQIVQLASERKRLQRQLQARKEEGKRLVSAVGGKGKPLPVITGRLSEIERSAGQTEGRLQEIDAEIEGHRGRVTAEDITTRLAEFEGVWGVLQEVERIALIESTIESVVISTDHDATVHFRQV